MPTQISIDDLAPSLVTTIEQAGSAVTISSIQITDSGGNVLDDTAVSTAGGYIKINGAQFTANSNIIIGSVVATSSTYVSPSVYLAQVPAQTAGSYTVYLVTSDGATATRPLGLTYSGTPAWVTGTTLTAATSGAAYSLQLSATGATSYALNQGSSLPFSLTLASGGLISGTVTVGTTTNYSFTVNAIDAELQDSPRTFMLQVMAPLPDQTFGWFGGGFTNGIGPISTVNRIDYSSDASTASTRGSLTYVSYAASAVGNQTYGWFTAGANPFQALNRITYASDTGLATTRGTGFERFRAGATGNTNYGWFGGGRPQPGPTPLSSVERLDYAIDTATTSSRGPLTSARYDLAATGNSDYGWFGGGVNSSTIDRINYSVDTATASLRGPLDRTAQRLAATGNNDYGWFGGGAPMTSRIGRIDYANDTGTTATRGPLSLARYGLGATGSTTFGWFGAGNSAPDFIETDRIDRINYASDTVNATTRGSLTTIRSDVSATGGFPG
jgi:hypothetical protein